MREALQNRVHIQIRGLPSPDECLEASSVLREEQTLAMTAQQKHSILRLEGSIAQPSWIKAD